MVWVSYSCPQDCTNVVDSVLSAQCCYLNTPDHPFSRVSTLHVCRFPKSTEPRTNWITQAISASSVVHAICGKLPISTFLLLWLTPSSSVHPLCVIVPHPRIWGVPIRKLELSRPPAPRVHSHSRLHSHSCSCSHWSFCFNARNDLMSKKPYKARAFQVFSWW